MTRDRLSCDICPYKQAEREAGNRWGKRRERSYCHGGKRPEKKGPRDGCAVLWPIWGAVGYFDEMLALIERGMKPPDHWSIEDWRLAGRIGRELELLRLDETREE